MAAVFASLNALVTALAADCRASGGSLLDVPSTGCYREA
jgi:hypothetical protein